MLRSAAVLLLLCVVSAASGCATVPARNPQAEAKASEANQALDVLNTDLANFYPDAEALLQRVRLLQQQPGWDEMEAVIRGTPAILAYVEGGEAVDFESIPETAAWSRKWKRPWKSLFSDYLGLVDRCSIMEARRTALLERLFVVQAKYIGATTMELSKGRYEQAQSLYSRVEMLTGTETELKAYQLNTIGLYDVRP